MEVLMLSVHTKDVARSLQRHCVTRKADPFVPTYLDFSEDPLSLLQVEVATLKKFNYFDLEHQVLSCKNGNVSLNLF